LPTGILPKIFVERATPVKAPRGESNRESPRLASLNPNLYLIPGIAATQVPNTRLEAENKNPTASAGLSFMKEEIFLIIMSYASRAVRCGFDYTLQSFIYTFLFVLFHSRLQERD
jgi:hypothetical protein